MLHHAVSKSRLGSRSASRQIQLRSLMPAWARMMRAPGIGLGEAHRVRPQGRDAAPGVDEDRQPVLAGQRRQLGHPRMPEREALRARMQLEPARARGQAATRLAQRVGLGIQPAQRHEPPAGLGGGRDHGVVGGRVAVGLLHREDHRPAVPGEVQAGEDLLRRGREAVRIVGADVGVRVDPLRPGGKPPTGDVVVASQDGEEIRAGQIHGRSVGPDGTDGATRRRIAVESNPTA